MELTRLGLDEETALALVRGVVTSQYSLITGAGFSVGAKGGTEDVPSAKRCAEILNDQFDLELTISSAADLSIAYEDALDAPSGADAVHLLFETLFTGCVPVWQSIVNKFDWRRVWTLNVDDLPDAIWSGSSRTVQHFDFVDRYRPLNSSVDELQVVYLHGRAATKRKKGGRYIFSITEYVDATKDAPPWHQAFFTEFSDRPLILCGASAVGEFDLARTFRSGSQSLETTGFPSIAVVKGMDSASARRFKNKLNLIPVNTDGLKFFSALKADVDEYRRENPQTISSRVSPAHARAFGHQFRVMGGDAAPLVRRRHDFHLGDEPEWSDIIANQDAVLTFAERGYDFVRTEIKAGAVPVICIVGDPGCGKSATLLRILQRCVSQGGNAYLFRGEEGLAVDAAVACLSQTTISLLAFDMGADFAADIAALVKRIREQKKPAAIVVADRLRRKKGLLNDIRSDAFLLLDHSSLASGDAMRVYEKRRSLHRLGPYVSRPPGDFRKLLVQKHGGNLFSALAEVEGGRGYFRRLDDHADALNEDAHSMLLAHSVCLTHRWGYSLPLKCASSISRLEVADLVTHCKDDGRFSDIFAVDSKGIRFRHRILADHYFQAFGDHEILYQSAKSIVEELAPLVNVEAIRAKSYPYLICRVLMERRSVISAVGGLDRAQDFYRELEPAFGGNSRFWEQRALLESEAGHHAKAYSYAHEAVSRERHAFPLTTLGRVCMAQALELGDSSAAAAFDKFKEGNAALLEARAVGAGRLETLGHPFTCFFDYATRLYPKLSKVGGAPTALKALWESWVADAAATKVYLDSSVLEEYRAKWIKAVLNSR